MNTTTTAVEVAGRLYHVTDADGPVIYLEDEQHRAYVGMPTYLADDEYWLSGMGPHSKIRGTFTWSAAA